jgi:hypothetical protein
VGFWVNLFARKQLYSSRFPQKPSEVVYHGVAEFVTAVFLIVAAAGLISGFTGARILTPLALGSVLYAEINGPGFYAAQKNNRMVIVFFVTAILTVIVIAVFLVSS